MIAPKCGNTSKVGFKRAQRGEMPKRIGWYHDPRFKLPGLSESGTRSIVQTAFDMAAMYVPIEFFRSATPGGALIVIKLGDPSEFDSETLALADMRSLYDPTPREIWFNPNEEYAISAKETATLALPTLNHEI